MDLFVDNNWYLHFREIKDDFQTDDILLVHGRYDFSFVIEAVQWSPFSHVGMIVRAEDIGLAGKTPDLLLWEANSLTNLPDVITGQAKPGPMLVDLEQRLSATAKDFEDVKFAFKPLYLPKETAIGTILQQLMPIVNQAGFPSDEEMANRFVEGRYYNKTAPTDAFFCSELLAHTFMEMGLLGTKYPMNAYAPKDFSDDGIVRLHKRAYFGNERFFNMQL